jgi:hypothetical protein
MANRALNSLIHLRMAVEMVRHTEESVCLAQRNCRDCQPVAAACDRDGGEDTVVGKASQEVTARECQDVVQPA